MPTPYDSIESPTPYTDWAATTQDLAANEKLFTAGASHTRTVVYPDVPYGSWPKYTFGYTISSVTNKPQFWFFLKLSDDTQEQAFQGAHKEWALTQGNANEHEYIIRDQPPTCGTETTPRCPPDPLLGGAMRYLRDVLAGAGADKTQLVNPAKQVEKFLVNRIRAEIEKLDGTLLAANPGLSKLGLQEAMSCLRCLKVGPSLTLNPAALDEATLEIETLLVGALKAAATQRLLKP